MARRRPAQGPQHPARPRGPAARRRHLRVRRRREPVACRSSAGSAGAASSGAATEARTVEEWSRRLEIKTESPSSLISTLSGGNQQKVVVARCLASDPKILVLCEPTAGVDIGTRVAIYDLVARLAREGLTVIVSSSDEGDLLAMCTRIVVLRNGTVASEMSGDGLTQQALVSAIEGES